MTSDVAQWSGLFAAAAEDPRRWPACLARLARTWSADDARLVPLPPVAECPVGEIAVGEGGRTLRAHLAPHPWCIALELTRAAASGAFAAEDLQRLRVAMPKLIAATAAARQLVLARLAGLLEGLALVHRAAVVLDAAGRVVARNRLMRTGSGIEIRDGSFQPAPGSRAKKAIDAALAVGGRSGCILGRPGGDGQVILCAEPLVEQAANPMQPGRLLVTLIDPSASETAESGLYRALFDLTPREAEIASLVAMGWPLQAISSTAGISLGHCRQRLQSVFRKTGTTRQGELAALLGRIR